VARNTLERGMNWVHRVFDELILPTTSVPAFEGRVLESVVFSGYAAYFLLIGGRPSSRQVGDVPTSCANIERSGLSWRCNSSWPGWQRLVPWRARRPCGHPLKLPASQRKTEPHRRERYCNGHHRAGHVGVKACACRG
jgi:hypothetical protein